MSWRIDQGDVIERLREMPSESVHCIVTSPPYFGQRNYGVDGQIGLEPTLEAYVAKMVDVFAEVRRVLRDDGTCWLNMGDGYAAGSRGTGGNRVETSPKQRTNSGSYFADATRPEHGLKAKDLMMVPARVALALQDAGWWLRSEITWCKPAPMPESVTDRPTSATEKIYLLTKAKSYFYDLDAERVAFAEPSAPFKGPTFTDGKTGVNGQGRVSLLPRKRGGHGRRHAGFNERWDAAEDEGTTPDGRNLWNYWVLPPEPSPGAHFAVFPSELPRRCISLGTSAKGVCAACGAPWKRMVERTAMVIDRSERTHEFGRTRTSGTMVEPPAVETLGWAPTCAHGAGAIPATVLDPFSGVATTGLAALRLERSYIGVELNPAYVEMARQRIIDDAPLLNAGAEALP